MEYLKKRKQQKTLDSTLSLSSTLLTHSLAWTGVWKLDPVFSECLWNISPPLTDIHLFLLPQNTHPHTRLLLTIFSLFFASRHLTARHYTGPGPLASSGFGVWNAQSMQYSWTQFFFPTDIVQHVFFFLFVCIPPILLLIYLWTCRHSTLCGYLFIYCLCLTTPPLKFAYPSWSLVCIPITYFYISTFFFFFEMWRMHWSSCQCKAE